MVKQQNQINNLELELIHEEPRRLINRKSILFYFMQKKKNKAHTKEKCLNKIYLNNNNNENCTG